MERDESVLLRVSQEEFRLVNNYRIVNEVRQETLLYFSDELVRLETIDLASIKNVVHLPRK